MDSSKLWIWIAILVAFVVITPWWMYSEMRIDVPAKHMAILMKKTGNDLEPGMIIAPTQDYKGVQKDVLTEGRYYYNPYVWNSEVVPQVEIPEGKLGVRIRIYGEDLAAGELIAWKETQKGIVPEVLRPGRYPINGFIQGTTPVRNDYAEMIELHDPVSIPAGYKGLLTNLAATMPEKANQILSPKDCRGVQADCLEPGTYYLNPYVQETRLIDCRSQRYNLQDIGFPTRDGFWVSLEGIIEFRVKPETAPTTYILFNEERSGKALDEEVIAKVILPNARAYTRLKGSNHSGKEFITGDTRVTFQEDFQTAMKVTCGAQGIEVIQALITTIRPPEQIADPVRRRQIALQQESQFTKEIAQQASEQDLAVQKATVLQKQAKVAADQAVVAVTTQALQRQEVAVIEAQKRLAVAEQQLLAAKDQAAAIMATGKAKADVVMFANEAEAAGWKRSIAAFGNNGNEFARWTLYKKLAPAFKGMMVNTQDSPLMDVFRTFDSKRQWTTTPAANAPITPSKN